jgi:hypothetical protein
VVVSPATKSQLLLEATKMMLSKRFPGWRKQHIFNTDSGMRCHTDRFLRNPLHACPTGRRNESSLVRSKQSISLNACSGDVAQPRITSFFLRI